MSYYQSKIVDLSFESAIARAKEELTREGFGILSDIDITATLKKKLDVDFRPYKILGACNPPFAHRALMTESHIGAMLPCNVVVQQTEEGQIEVSVVDPVASMAAVENPEMLEIAKIIREKLFKAFDAI